MSKYPFDRKLEYVTETMFPKYIVDTYPQFVNLVRVWLRYMDTCVYSVPITLTDASEFSAGSKITGDGSPKTDISNQNTGIGIVLSVSDNTAIVKVLSGNFIVGGNVSNTNPYSTTTTTISSISTNDIEYLDGGYNYKIREFQENTCADSIYEEFLDSYMSNYFAGIVNLDKYKLTSETKRKLLSLSKIIMNYKGNRKSIEILFRSLLNIKIYDSSEFASGSPLEIEQLNAIYSEDPDYIYTYYFEVDIDYSKISEIVDQIHPAGFKYVYSISPFYTEEETSFTEVTHTYTGECYFYDGLHKYNGSITYGTISQTEYT